MIRLQKFLADNGVCSRRKAEMYIIDGLVKVNNDIITELGTKVDPLKDKVFFKNRLIGIETEKIYIMLNKPKGCVTTADDELNRKTVFHYLRGINKKVVSIGRLDYNTTGLLLFTNDGDLTYKLTHPSHNINKIYIVKIRGSISEYDIQKLRDGILIDGYKTNKAKISVMYKEKGITTLKIAISEGKNRQVRRMIEAVSHIVTDLKRVAIEELELGELEAGQHRKLTSQEIKYLKEIT